MEPGCDYVREQMAAFMADLLPPVEAQAVKEHVHQCSACRGYFEGLQSDDRLLTEFVESMQSSLVRVTDGVTASLEGHSSGRLAATAGDVRLIRVVWRVAAAVLVVGAVLVGAVVLWLGQVQSPGPPIVKDTEPPVLGTEPQRPTEFERIRRMVSARDIDGLVAMLRGGQPDSRVAVANLLMQMGDDRAIPALQELAAEWKGDPLKNPFTDAIAAIQDRAQTEPSQAPSSGTHGPDKQETSESVPVGDAAASRITGVAKNQQGQPVSDAAVLLYHVRSRWGLGNEIVEQARTGADGVYTLAASLDFDRIRQHAYAQDSYVLLALHADYAVAWQNIEQGQDEREYDLTLTAPTVRTIMVTDHEGDPLPGARVWLYSAGDRKSFNPLFRDYLRLPTDIGLIGSRTDASGCAVVTNLPDTGCSFHASLEGYATGLAFSGQDRIRLSPGADVSGLILTESGDPVGGAKVRFKTKWMHQYFVAESDSEGRFAFSALPARGWDMGPWGESEGASGAYTIAVEHEDYAVRDTDIELLPGQTVDDLVISVSDQTTLVRCLVLEEGTDEPVAGARISGDNMIGSINGYSDANGVFTVRVLPGPVSLQFHSPPDGVYVMKSPLSGDYRVKFDARGGSMDVELPAPLIAGRLCSVRGTVYDLEGLPVSNAVVYAAAGRFNTATATGYVRPAGADTNGRFELQEVPAGRDLHIYAETKERMLAFADVFPIPADVNELKPLELILQPTATAVAVIEDEQGNLATSTALSIDPVVRDERIWPAGRKGQTDHLGALEIDGIVPGLAYHLRDARFDEVGGRRPDGWEEWLDREIVLIPLE